MNDITKQDHKIEAPTDLTNSQVVMLPVYSKLHRHDTFHDIEELGEELTDAIVIELEKAKANGSTQISDR